MTEIYRPIRVYDSLFRRNLKHKLTKLTNKDDYIFIYKTINEDNSKLSISRNGIYFNLNLLSDNCIEKINVFLNNRIDTETEIEPKIIKKYEISPKNYLQDIQFITGSKLNNQEKSLIKKFNQEII